MTGRLKTIESMQASEEENFLSERPMRNALSATSRSFHTSESGNHSPLSLEQYQSWLQAAMDPELPIGNESFTVRKDGAFNAQSFEAALNEVLKRHEILRTHLQRQSNEEWAQIVQPELKVRLGLIDLSTLPVEQREKESERIATENAVLPFDLTAAPPFRVRLIRMSAAEHRLQLTIHGTLADSSSIHRLFASELAAIYAAFERGEAPEPAETNLQYGDYAIWQQGQRDNPKHLAYWRSQLAGEIPLLRLPSDRPRPAVLSHRGAAEYFDLPEDLTWSIRALAGAHNVSIDAVLLAAFNTMLFRYTGQEDVLLGAVADARRQPEFQRVLGCFSNTFAVRTRPSAEQTFSSFLKSVHHNALAAMEAARQPFSRIVQRLERSRDTAPSPQLQAVLAFQPRAARLPSGWSVSRTKTALIATKFELHIEVEEYADAGIAAAAKELTIAAAQARIAYSTDLFDAATIRRMAGHWMTLLAAAAKNPELKLGELSMLSPEEQRQMLVLWNRTEAPAPRRLLCDAVENIAMHSPAAIAVEFEGESRTYLQLTQDLSRIASHLLRSGSKRGQIVAVCLNRSQHLPAALLGVLRTGAAYLPLDPAAPFARVQLCLEDAEPVILLTQQSLLEGLPPTKATVILLEDCIATEASCLDVQQTSLQENGLPEPIAFEDAAYIIHTSGSTGRPKAVEISHGALMNFLESMRLEPGFAAADTLLAVTTLSFDIAGLELFLPLIAGGRVVVVSRETVQDPYLLAAAIEQSSCSVMQATPATWRSLLDSGWRGRAGLRVFCGGEPLTPSLAKRLIAQGLELWNLYGPTETTVWSTLQRITRADQPISVGHPIANTTIYILDARQQAVPIGIPGDLYIGGLGLANGYRGQPQLTAEKFRTPKIAGGARLYFTGDTALYRADGTIEVQGRTDNQVKIRGFRIELEEVEAAMAAHPGIASAVAMAWPDASGGHQLCGYVVGRGGSPPAAAELRQFLASRLPNYMVPSAIVALDALPVTLNGKMDRKALKAPAQQPVSSSEIGSAISNPASTPNERRLVAIWAELLCTERIGLDDNFFDLGGHSLLVARLQYRIHLEFGWKLPMASLFHAPTVAQQIELLHERESGPSPSGIIPIQTHGMEPRLFWIQPPPRIGRLAAAMGTNQPFFGVAITLAEMDTLGPNPRLEDFARLYADSITQFQPRGPYHLCGFCAGGVLAYAVASRLAALGHEIASLALLDAENPVFFRRFGSVKTELNKFWFYLRRTQRKGGIRNFLTHTHFRLKQFLKLPEPAATEMSLLENAIVAAVARYEPPMYGGDVFLICADERPSSVNYYPGWKAVVRGKLTSINVSGHHDDLVSTANVPSIATAIVDCMTACRHDCAVAS